MGKRKGRKATQEIPELADEIGENGEEEGEVGFFACYLLTSLCPRFKGQTYIGYTLNPRRRIRQHNGEIGCGAWRTKRKRPWEMVLCIYGFPTNIAALQFEWAWQHPVESLAVRNAAASFKSLSGLANKIKLAYTMLTLPAWQRLNLTVNLFSTKYQIYTAACPALPEQMRTQVCSMDDLPCYSGNTRVNNEWNGDHDENEFEEEESRILAAVDKSPSYDGSPGENEEFSHRCDAGTEPSGCLARTQTGWPSNSPPNREEEEVHEQPFCTNESPTKSSFSFARSYVDEDPQSSRCAKSSREIDEPLNNRSATASVAEDQILIKSPDISAREVEVIDLFTPSPCYAINSGRKRRRPNLCPEIIDLTNSPVYA